MAEKDSDRQGQEFGGGASQEAYARLVHKQRNYYGSWLSADRREDEDDYYDVFEELPDDQLTPRELAVKQALTYEAFYPDQEVREIRHLSPEEKTLPPEEQREIRRGRIEHFKQELEMQRAGIAKTIQTVYDQIQASPDITQEDLWKIVTESAPGYKFDYRHLLSFYEGIESYVEKHQAVEKYAKMHPEAADLFEACFGERPKGKVDVVKGPMTLMFRCWDEEDYAFLYNSGKKEVSKDSIAIANLTAGCALYECQVEELAGVITAENGKYLPRKTEEVEEANHEIISDFHLFWHDNLKELTITPREGGVWRITKEYVDEFIGKYRLVLRDTSLPENILMDYVIREEGLVWFNGDASIESSAPSPLNISEVDEASYQQRVFTVTINPGMVKITNKSWEQMIDTTAVYNASRPLDEFDDSKPDATRVHEDQHQFNKLFQPLEKQTSVLSIVEEVVDQELPAEQAIAQLILGAVRKERKFLGIDERARDEILSYFKDGRSLDSILDTLSSSELYNYKKRNAEYLKTVPGNVQDLLSRYVRVWTAEDSLEDITVDPRKVEETIDRVFGEEYQKDLGKWIAALGVMEAKGYSRQEVLALAYQEPVHRWIAMARRILEKTKDRP